MQLGGESSGGNKEEFEQEGIVGSDQNAFYMYEILKTQQWNFLWPSELDWNTLKCLPWVKVLHG